MYCMQYIVYSLSVLHTRAGDSKKFKSIRFSSIWCVLVSIWFDSIYWCEFVTSLINHSFNRAFTNCEAVMCIILNATRQHRKALWHNSCPSHNLLRRFTLIHDLDNKRGEGMQEWKTKIIWRKVVNKQKNEIWGVTNLH